MGVGQGYLQDGPIQSVTRISATTSRKFLPGCDPIHSASSSPMTRCTHQREDVSCSRLSPLKTSQLISAWGVLPLHYRRVCGNRCLRSGSVRPIGASSKWFAPPATKASPPISQLLSATADRTGPRCGACRLSWTGVDPGSTRPPLDWNAGDVARRLHAMGPFGLPGCAGEQVACTAVPR